MEGRWAGLGRLAPGAGEQLFLTLYAEPGHAEELFAFMEDAVADPRFVTEACAALDSAGVLSDVPLQHLQHGLRHLGELEVFNGGRHRSSVFEGAFSGVAIAQAIAIPVGTTCLSWTPTAVR
jgi:hypothetical protein